MDLELARAALGRGDPKVALEHALAAWQAEPCPALARAIRALSARSAPEASPLIRGSGLTAQLAWSQLADQADPQHVPALLATFFEVSSSDCISRLEQVRRWPADPRVDEWCVSSLEHLPWSDELDPGYWGEHFRRLEKVRDAALLPRLEALHALWRRQGENTLRGELGRELGERLRMLRHRLQARSAESPEALALERQLSPPLDGGPLLEELLASVYAEPERDEPRLVYADALMERGDPRGEFIALQIGRQHDRRARARAKELLAEHGHRWLGPLRPLLRADFVFERGFLARCALLSLRGELAPEILLHPAFATVRSLSGSLRIGLRRDLRGLRELEVRMQAAVDQEGLQRPWAELLLGGPRPITSLTYHPCRYPDHEELTLLARCDSLPQLRALRVQPCDVQLLRALNAGPVLDRLETLGLQYVSEDWQPLVELYAAARVPALELALEGPYELTELALARGPSGYDSLEASFSPVGATAAWSRRLVDEFLDRLAALAVPLRTARVKFRAIYEPELFDLTYQGLRRLGVAEPLITRS
jgi:uncharacterized protein (TIGR02996 family)